MKEEKMAATALTQVPIADVAVFASGVKALVASRGADKWRI
jgi:hypothetical protein